MIPDFAIRTKADELAIEQNCYWDQSKAEHIVKFSERFFRSQFIQGKLKLAPEQKQFLQCIQGWRLPNGNRRFRFANLHVPKKSFGKTLLVSILAFYELLASGEPSPVVCAAAASLQNASQVYDELSYAIEHSPFNRFCHRTPHQKKLKFDSLNASFSSLSSDGKRVHGLNCSMVIEDECHATPNAELHNAMRWAIAARPNGLNVLISTSGKDQTHWYYSVYEKSKRVQKGEDLDITHFAQIHEAEQEGNPLEPEQWKLANPLLGSSWCPVDQFQRDVESAKSGGVGEFLNFRRLRLNQWVKSDELAWLDVANWSSFQTDPSEDELKRYPASIGYDGSETTDPSSCTILWALPENKFYARSWCWVAKEAVKLREAVNLPKYEEFEEQGSLKFTPGDMIDSRQIRDHIIGLCQSYDVRTVNFDPRGAYSMAFEIEEQGYHTERVPQSFRYFNPIMREFSKCYTEGRFQHNGSTWLKYCLSNVRIEVNRYDEIRPVRKKSTDHIDAGVSLLLAYLGLLNKNLSQGILWV